MTNIGFKEIYDHVSVNSLMTCKGRSYPKKIAQVTSARQKKVFVFVCLFVFYRLFVS